ncbi:hypothetical protein BZA05DRAFT_426050 [Tricharina praecox]|uniref:uncharacterized protein n=1 Tax=Tricharina praecox TaxID=43433 RepID=UPI0022206531|nr:uncharacterized protein BZA05DRAFT_426050 [Tricharina praecox]KAI5849740.1 hypothetical protein BZA05DRAFT_426050 [Tricharina praecox]
MPQPLGVAGLPPNTKIIEKSGARVLCVADVRGHLRTLNELAKKANADYIIHTGDFGFYDDSSLERIADKTLRHVVQYSPLLEDSLKKQVQAPGPQNIKSLVQQVPHALSELPLFLNGTYSLDVPVYTVWGACEDVRVLERFRSGEYKVPNLHIIDEASSRLLDVGGVKLRLLGLGGAVVMHKLFDNGEGKTTIAGGQGTMWTTLLQMGDLIDTATRVYDPAETRIFITHNSPAREGLLNQLSVTLKADFSISAGLHFRYGSSYNEFSVNPSLDYYRGKLASSKASFNDVWETVKGEVQPAVEQSARQQRLLENALAFIEKMPTSANGGNPFGGPSASNAPGAGQVDESAFKNMWNFNLADAAFGWLILEIEGGRIGTEMKAQGFNFSHRGGKIPHPGYQQALPPSQPTPIAPAVPLGPRKNVSNPARTSPPPPTGPSPRIEPAVPAVKPATPRPAPAVANRAPTPAAAPEPSSPEEQKPGNSNGAQEEDTREPLVPSTGHSSNPATPVAEGPNYRSKYGLHVQNAATVTAVKELISEDVRKYIVDIQEKTSKTGGLYHLLYTETDEQAREILNKLPKELTTRNFDRDDTRVHFKPLDMGPNRRGHPEHRVSRGGGIDSSKWSRGQAIGGNTSESDNSGPGYRRGGFGGGRGGKPRGQGFERGVGRGGRGGGGGKRGGRFGEGGEGGGAPAQTE